MVQHRKNSGTLISSPYSLLILQSYRFSIFYYFIKLFYDINIDYFSIGMWIAATGSECAYRYRFRHKRNSIDALSSCLIFISYAAFCFYKRINAPYVITIILTRSRTFVHYYTHAHHTPWCLLLLSQDVISLPICFVFCVFFLPICLFIYFSFTNTLTTTYIHTVFAHTCS